MSYAPIMLEAPQAIRDFVSKRVEPYLHDVRVMLRTPLAPGEPTLNFSIATVLCGVIGGLASVFYNDLPKDNESFKATAERYPIEDEPDDGILDPKLFAESLYGVYRCTLVHSLGLHMKRPNSKARWAISVATDRYVVARHNGGSLTESQLADLDRPTGRLAGLQATLKRSDGKIRLDVDALYSGVRRLVRILAMDPKLQTVAVPVLQPWFDAERNRNIDFQLRTATQSSQPTILCINHSAVDASLGPKQFSSEFARIKITGGKAPSGTDTTDKDL